MYLPSAFQRSLNLFVQFVPTTTSGERASPSSRGPHFRLRPSYRLQDSRALIRSGDKYFRLQAGIGNLHQRFRGEFEIHFSCNNITLFDNRIRSTMMIHRCGGRMSGELHARRHQARGAEEGESNSRSILHRICIWRYLKQFHVFHCAARERGRRLSPPHYFDIASPFRIK